MKRTDAAGSCPVPDYDVVRDFFGPVSDWIDGCQIAGAGITFLDADDQLRFWGTCLQLFYTIFLKLLFVQEWERNFKNVA